MRRDMGSRGEVWVPGGRVADALGAGGGCVCEPGPRARAGRRSPPDGPRVPQRPAPAARRRRVACRAPPPPQCPDAGDVRPPSSSPGQPAPVGASASRRRHHCLCQVLCPLPPPCKPPACPPATRHPRRPAPRGPPPPEEGPGRRHRGGGVPPAPPVPPTRAAAARDCAWTPGTGPGRSGAGDGPGGGGERGPGIRPPAPPQPPWLSVISGRPRAASRRSLSF